MLIIGIRRGTFIEFRNGMINVSPIGRNATFVLPHRPHCPRPHSSHRQKERDEFAAYDKVNLVSTHKHLEQALTYV